eukprot:TRINITY_DN21198_c0_g1_i1.p1 TRINITY_DN21198_c0_g1~~TRINITY_DN21198_c0_g1_i1.p1  ORF type:complete len:521 (-),score=78.35 TRINITY_DN21198_c0_g1_i1:54-1616(-)
MSWPGFLVLILQLVLTPAFAETALDRIALLAASVQNMMNVAFVCFCAIGISLFLLMRYTHRRRADDDQRELRAFTEWAKQHIQQCSSETNSQLLDDVICMFAGSAKELAWVGNANKKVTSSIDGAVTRNSEDVRQAAALRLRVLGELLRVPGVCRALRAANWAFSLAWDQKRLTSEEVRLRCTVIFPTIQAAAAQSHAAAKKKGARGVGAFGGMVDSKLDLSYVANWCDDFLERPDVSAYLQRPCKQGEDGWEVAGSESNGCRSDSDEEIASTVGTVAAADGRGDSAPDWFPRQSMDGQRHCWSSPDATTMNVRGARYCEDKVKVKSDEAMLELLTTDLFKADSVVHYYANPKCHVRDLRANGESRFLFIVNFRLPPVHYASVWAVPENPQWERSPAGVLFRRFLHMNNAERRTRFKVLPRIKDGPWLVKAALPEKPSLMCRKLESEFFQSDNHLEVSVNCLSSPAARHIVSVLSGAGRAFAVQTFMIIEGKTADELPERILGGMQASYCDLPSMGHRKC